jgi:hypothetical protein
LKKLKGYWLHRPGSITRKLPSILRIPHSIYNRNHSKSF